MEETPRLGERLERALRGRCVEELLPTPRALVGFEAAVASSMDRVLARRAVEKLRAGDRLLPNEWEVLEAGIRLARPALRINRGRLPFSPALGLDDATQAVLEAQLLGIASVGWRWGIPLATAFQVSPRVLLTSAHVAEKLLHDSEALAGGQFVACFDAEDSRPESAIPITGVLACHPLEDVAFLALASDGPLVQGLRLARTPAFSWGQPLLAVGYPIYSDSHPPWVDMLFENVYAVKRASPGELLGMEGERVFHDCTTLSGNSGSPLFDLRTGHVIGIHASGQFAWRNTAVSTRAIHALGPLQALVSTWE